MNIEKYEIIVDVVDDSQILQHFATKACENGNLKRNSSFSKNKEENYVAYNKLIAIGQIIPTLLRTPLTSPVGKM